MKQVVAAALVVGLIAGYSIAWDAAGHRAITLAAMQGLPESVPAWLKDKSTMEQVADQATVPDRWRSTRVAQLTHLNNPDHYIDIEDLEPFGMSIDKLPILRYEFVKELTLARERGGAEFKGRPASGPRDFAKVAEWPGFLPYAIAEQYAKVQNAFSTVRILEQLNDPKREEQLKMARANAMYNMGILSHMVGDAAQPLHTTRHHHGWEGPNPEGYTTDTGIHSYIDGAIVRHHSIDAKTIVAGAHFDLKVAPNDPWDSVIAHIKRSFEQVEPLYKLKKSGELEGEPGRALILERMTDGARMLEALYQAAWESAAATDKSVSDFVKYDNFDK
ncbi:MAG: hypothetical protein ACOYN0_10685 [Phycisphaerales bacterium]